MTTDKVPEDVNRTFGAFCVMMMHFQTVEDDKYDTGILINESVTTNSVTSVSVNGRVSKFSLDIGHMMANWGSSDYGADLLNQLVSTSYMHYKNLKKKVLMEIEEETVEEKIDEMRNYLNNEKKRLIERQKVLFDTRKKQRELAKTYGLVF